MRIVFYNPQASVVIGTTLYNWLLGIFSYNKYLYLIKNKPIYQDNLIFFIDSNGTSLLPKWLGKIVHPKMELYFWLFINHISPFKVTILTSPKDISKNDILIGFSVNLLDNSKSDLSTLSKIKCIKLFHLTHFIQNTTLISENAKRIKVNYFFAENNLFKNSPYFRKYFNWYKKDVYTLPFAFRDQFKETAPFSSRKNKAMAIGTVVDVGTTESSNKFKHFTSFFKTTIIQPMRYSIYSERQKNKLYIDSYISELYENKQKTESKTQIERLSNAIFNATKATKRTYFSFSMTDIFNKYKMFVNGEEISNLPGIGFVQGMACGCAYIAQNDPMYTDIGLIPDKHYISYDGTMTGLINKIKQFQNNPMKLREISESGRYFIRHHFSKVFIANHFFEDLYHFSNSNVKPNTNQILKCSFTQHEV